MLAIPGASGLSQLELIISLESTYQPEKIPQRDMMEPPKFTQPLTDRTTTRGYSTHLFCSVRGFPQVSGSSMDSIILAWGHQWVFCKVAGGLCEMVGAVRLALGEVKWLHCPLSQTGARLGCFCMEMGDWS